MPGPLKKRPEERVRRNKIEGVVTVGDLKPVTHPPEKREWHPEAKAIYRSFKESGQVEYWQQSDWEYARFTMGQISRMLKQAGDKPLRAGQLEAINNMLKELLMTEPSRRRINLELRKPTAKPAGEATVTDIADYTGIYG